MGDFLDPHQPWEMGVNPTCRWGLTGSHKVFAQSDSLWDLGTLAPASQALGFLRRKGQGEQGLLGSGMQF